VEYLRGNATASATGLLVICRYLTSFEEGRNEEDLRKSLQVLRSLTSSQNETSAVLKASLAVGEGLGLVFRQDSSSSWMVDRSIAERLSTAADVWPWFRGELLHRIGIAALKDIEEGSQPSDLAIGLTWFLQLDPLRPPNLAWGSGPEKMVNEIGFGAITRSEQWRPFQRWAIATGLAHRCEHREAKVLIPDASVAIVDQLPHLPTAASAQEWLSSLRTRLPFLGSAAFLNQLPQGGRDWESLPPSVVFGLLKLERKGVLRMESPNDAVEVTAIRFGDMRRQVARISVGASK
jgi:hypothetical protein